MSLRRKTLSCLLAASFLLLLAFSVRALLVRSVFENASLMRDVWFQVTLLDAYLGFVTVYVWVAWKEQTTTGRMLWFLLIMAFGNMAVSAYILIQIINLPADSSLSEILTQRCPTSNSAPTAA